MGNSRKYFGRTSYKMASRVNPWSTKPQRGPFKSILVKYPGNGHPMATEWHNLATMRFEVMARWIMDTLWHIATHSLAIEPTTFGVKFNIYTHAKWAAIRQRMRWNKLYFNTHSNSTINGWRLGWYWPASIALWQFNIDIIQLFTRPTIINFFTFMGNWFSLNLFFLLSFFFCFGLYGDAFVFKYFTNISRLAVYNIGAV